MENACQSHYSHKGGSDLALLFLKKRLCSNLGQFREVILSAILHCDQLRNSNIDLSDNPAAKALSGHGFFSLRLTSRKPEKVTLTSPAVIAAASGSNFIINTVGTMKGLSKCSLRNT